MVVIAAIYGIGVDNLEYDRCIPTMLDCINPFDFCISDVTVVENWDFDVDIGVDNLEEDRCIPTMPDSCTVDVGIGVDILEEDRCISTVMDFGYAVDANAVDVGVSVLPMLVNWLMSLLTHRLTTQPPMLLQ